MSDRPTILYVVKGERYLHYTYWSLRSLFRFGPFPVDIVASTEREGRLLLERFPDVACTVIDGDTGGYPQMSYKQFVLPQYLRVYGFQNPGHEVVICDADVMWLKDPAPLFRRFRDRNWVQKITALDPRELGTPADKVERRKIGLRTILNYSRRFPVRRYPNYYLNGGLYMLRQDIFREMMPTLARKIFDMPSDEMHLADALLALTYAELDLVPVSDRRDIKYLGVEEQDTDLPLHRFAIAPDPRPGEATGYETAKHFYRDQRMELYDYVEREGLDEKGYVAEARSAERRERSSGTRLRRRLAGAARRLAGA